MTLFGKQNIRLINLHLFELEQLHTYLEEMAAKGWMLSSIHTTWIRFTACEPQEVSFYIDIYPKGSYINPLYIDDKEKDYIAFLQEYGYEPITKNANFQIFVSHQTQPIPIHSDESEDMLQERKQAILKFEWVNYLITLVIMFLLLLLTLWTYQDNFYTYTQTAPSLIAISCFLFILRGLPSLRWLIQKERYHKTYLEILHRDQMFFVLWFAIFLFICFSIFSMFSAMQVLWLWMLAGCMLPLFFLLDHIFVHVSKTYHGALSLLIILLLFLGSNHLFIQSKFQESALGYEIEDDRMQIRTSFFITTTDYNQIDQNDPQFPYDYTIYSLHFPFMKEYLVDKFMEPFNNVILLQEEDAYTWMQTDFYTILVKDEHIIQIQHIDFTKEEIVALLSHL